MHSIRDKDDPRGSDDIKPNAANLALTDGKLCNCDKYPEHNTNSDECWCEPEIIVMENGNKVIVHNEEN